MSAIRVETAGAILEFENGKLFEEVTLVKRKLIGKGDIVGYGIYTGLCEGEVPSATSSKPQVGLQLMFKKVGSLDIDFVSGEITRIHRA